MRFLWTLSNSVVAGALGALYVIVLVLLLNPAMSLGAMSLLRLIATIGLFYAVHLMVIVYALLAVRQLFGGGTLSSAWVSLSVLVWPSAFAAVAAAAVMWANLVTYTLVLKPDTRDALSASVVVLASSAALLLCIGLLRRRGVRRVLLGGCAVTVMAASLMTPLVIRGPARVEAPPALSRVERRDLTASDRQTRVRVIALDAGSLEIITSATAAGRLPNFGRILDTGAVTHLATLHPTSIEAVWGAFATGKLPQKNGVRSAAVYHLTAFPGAEPLQLLPDFCFANGLIRFGILDQQATTSESLRSSTLWTILSDAGVRVGVVNFPLTYPAPPVTGFVVSDAFVHLSGTPTELVDPRSLYPPSLQRDAVTLAQEAGDEPAPSPPFDQIPDRYREASRTDRMYERLQRGFTETYAPDVTLLRFQSPDPIAHYFLRYAMPTPFGNVSDDDRSRYGGVLEAHYALVDDAIGREIASLDADDVLFVVSGFGIEPLGIGKRILEQLIGDPDISGTHEAAPDGFLMAYGAPVAHSRSLRRASIVDVAPTVLYYLGLPVARDMDGYARADLFQRAFTAEHPITYIPTYDQ